MVASEVTLFRLGLFWGGLVLFLSLELLIPYRSNSVSKTKRWLNNLGLTFLNSLLLQFFFLSLIAVTVSHVQTQQMGLLNLFHIPFWLNILVTILVFDFMIYIWHFLNHKIPFLWRFHRVHHSDLNMDVSTATRFHIGELAISSVLKICLLYFLGAQLIGFILFESVLVLCAQFHHSSLKVPSWFEKLFWILFVPPSMHRIHHSVVIRERDTNYGTILSIWDRILGTLVSRVDQRGIRIGIGAYRNPNKLNLHQLLLMPLTRPVK